MKMNTSNNWYRIEVKSIPYSKAKGIIISMLKMRYAKGMRMRSEMMNAAVYAHRFCASNPHPRAMRPMLRKTKMRPRRSWLDLPVNILETNDRIQAPTMIQKDAMMTTPGGDEGTGSDAMVLRKVFPFQDP